MKKLILVANDSPHTGKSLISALLSFYLQRRGIPHHHIQSDEDNNLDKDRLFFDLLYEPDAAELIEAIDQHPATIYDIPSGQSQEFLEFFTEKELPSTLEELEVEMTLLCPVDGSESSLDSLIELGASLGDLSDIVIAHNSALSESYMKDYWAGSEAEAALEGTEVRHLQIPDLFDEESGTLSELAADLAAGVSLEEEEQQTDEELVDALERNVTLCFTPIEELLVGSSDAGAYDWGSGAKKATS